MTMDVNETWRDLSQAVEQDDWQEASQLAETLGEWINKGGFPPTITGNAEFDRIVARATAESIAAWETVT